MDRITIRPGLSIPMHAVLEALQDATANSVGKIIESIFKPGLVITSDNPNCFKPSVSGQNIVVEPGTAIGFINVDTVRGVEPRLYVLVAENQLSISSQQNDGTYYLILVPQIEYEPPTAKVAHNYSGPSITGDIYARARASVQLATQSDPWFTIARVTIENGSVTSLVDLRHIYRFYIRTGLEEDCSPSIKPVVVDVKQDFSQDFVPDTSKLKHKVYFGETGTVQLVQDNGVTKDLKFVSRETSFDWQNVHTQMDLWLIRPDTKGPEKYRVVGIRDDGSDKIVTVEASSWPMGVVPVVMAPKHVSSEALIFNNDGTQLLARYHNPGFDSNIDIELKENTVYRIEVLLKCSSRTSYLSDPYIYTTDIYSSDPSPIFWVRSKTIQTSRSSPAPSSNSPGNQTPDGLSALIEWNAHGQIKSIDDVGKTITIDISQILDGDWEYYPENWSIPGIDDGLPYYLRKSDGTTSLITDYSVNENNKELILTVETTSGFSVGDFAYILNQRNIVIYHVSLQPVQQSGDPVGRDSEHATSIPPAPGEPNSSPLSVTITGVFPGTNYSLSIISIFTDGRVSSWGPAILSFHSENLVSPVVVGYANGSIAVFRINNAAEIVNNSRFQTFRVHVQHSHSSAGIDQIISTLSDEIRIPGEFPYGTQDTITVDVFAVYNDGEAYDPTLSRSWVRVRPDIPAEDLETIRALAEQMRAMSAAGPSAATNMALLMQTADVARSGMLKVRSTVIVAAPPSTPDTVTEVTFEHGLGRIPMVSVVPLSDTQKEDSSKWKIKSVDENRIVIEYWGSSQGKFRIWAV